MVPVRGRSDVLLGVANAPVFIFTHDDVDTSLAVWSLVVGGDDADRMMPPTADANGMAELARKTGKKFVRLATSRLSDGRFVIWLYTYDLMRMYKFARDGDLVMEQDMVGLPFPYVGFDELLVGHYIDEILAKIGDEKE